MQHVQDFFLLPLLHFSPSCFCQIASGLTSFPVYFIICSWYWQNLFIASSNACSYHVICFLIFCHLETQCHKHARFAKVSGAIDWYLPLVWTKMYGMVRSCSMCKNDIKKSSKVINNNHYQQKLLFFPFEFVKADLVK